MARLPIVGKDDGEWGNLLNAFLSVEHKADGTLKTSGTLSTKADDSETVHVDGNETIGGVKTFSSSPIVPTPTSSTQVANKAYVDATASSGAPDASSSTKGLVRLTGDLGGTADSPTVPGLAGKQNADADLTAIAGLSPSNDDVIQRKSGAWTNRTMAQVKTDLSLSKSDVGLANVDNTSDATKNSAAATLTNKTIDGGSNTLTNIPQGAVTNLENDLDAKVSTSRTITAGTGLTGGGDLSANRTLAVNIGTTSGTVAAGDDPRFSAGGTYYDSGYGATQSLISKLRMNKRNNINIVQYGDSTSATISSWPGKLTNKMATAWPAWSFRFADWSVDGNTDYSSPSTISTGSGSGVVTWYNMGIPSTNTQNVLGSKFSNAVLAVPSPDLIVIGHGHNEYAGTGASDYDPPAYSSMAAFIATLKLYHPSVPIVLVLGNPVAIASNSTQERRNDAYRRLAADTGIGLIDVFHAFTAHPDWDKSTPAPTLMTDATHPNSNGLELWADTMLPYFSPPSDVNSKVIPPVAQPISSLAIRTKSFLTNGDFSTYASSPGAPDDWTTGGSPTVTKDTGTVDTTMTPLTYSVKIEASGSSVDYISQSVSINEVRGKVICLTARVYIPTAAPAGNASGMISIVVDGTDNFCTTTNYGRGGWFFRSIHVRVPVTASTVSVRLFGSTSSSVAGVAYFSEATLSMGSLPMRSLPPATVSGGGGGGGGSYVGLTGDETVAGSKTFSSEVTAPSFKATGTAGAPQQGRFVGVTTSGAPTTGTYGVGDFVLDQNGLMFVCTDAGTPGTWVTPMDTRNMLATGDETFSRAQRTTNVSSASGRLHLTYFTARKSETTQTVYMFTGSTGTSGLTLGRIGLYSIASDGSGTLVASTASSTTLFNNLLTKYTQTWTTPYAKVAGKRYALGVLVVGTTAGNIAGYDCAMTGELDASPRVTGALTGQTDLPSSFTNASLSNIGAALYGVLMP